jgi:hypothetical protein
VHWDADAQVGGSQRLTAGGDRGAPSPGLGPMFELQGHVAVLPMLRAGLYLEQDVSPAQDAGPRTFWAGGLHARVTPPLLSSPWRSWLFAGVGVAYAYSKAVHTDGGMLDLPLGVGLGRKVGHSWMLFAELGVRFGALFYGAMYDHAAARPDGVPYVGQDSFALTASVGLSLDR